jgi:hypothetical protein
VHKEQCSLMTCVSHCFTSSSSASSSSNINLDTGEGQSQKASKATKRDKPDNLKKGRQSLPISAVDTTYPAIQACTDTRVYRCMPASSSCTCMCWSEFRAGNFELGLGHGSTVVLTMRGLCVWLLLQLHLMCAPCGLKCGPTLRRCTCTLIASRA